VADKNLRDKVERLDENYFFSQLAEGIDLSSTPLEKLSPAEQWKVALDTGEKTALDLIYDLKNAPGKPKPGMPLGTLQMPYYEPGPVQRQFHEAPESLLYVAGGRRAGKSASLAAQLLPYMFQDYAYIWLVSNDYRLCHAEFDYIADWLRYYKAPIVKYNHAADGQWKIELKWGAILETMTGADDDKIEMANLNAVGITEAGQTNKSLLTKLMGRVVQRRGKIFMTGSMNESQAWYVNAIERYQNGDEFGDQRSFFYSLFR